MKKAMSQMLAQGDVLLIGVDAIPKGAQSVADGVVALGEATGHAHRLAQKANLFRLSSGEMYVEALGGGSLVHEEHGALALDGLYRVVIQREFDGQYSRQVTD